MKKWLFPALLVALMLAAGPTGYSQDLPAGPRLIAKSAMVVRADSGTVLFQKNIDEKRAVASTQKLLTALIIVENGKLDEKITVAKTDGMVPPRNLWITSGSRYLRQNLLEAMLVRSFNDVTKCLTRSQEGSQSAFAKVMQVRAQELGMNNSVFLNAHGLTTPGQYSTARDMMILARKAWANPEIRRIVQIKKMNFTYHGGATIELENSNDLLHSYPECIGMKTGYTEAAGRCLIAAGKRGNNTVLAVILGSSFDGIWEDSEKLLRWSLSL